MKGLFDTKQTFSLRKLKAYGTASVLLGMLALANPSNPGVQADEVEGGSPSPTSSDESLEAAAPTASPVLETDHLFIQTEGSEQPSAQKLSELSENGGGRPH